MEWYVYVLFSELFLYCLKKKLLCWFFSKLFIKKIVLNNVFSFTLCFVSFSRFVFILIEQVRRCEFTVTSVTVITWSKCDTFGYSRYDFQLSLTSKLQREAMPVSSWPVINSLHQSRDDIRKLMLNQWRRFYTFLICISIFFKWFLI